MENDTIKQTDQRVKTPEAQLTEIRKETFSQRELEDEASTMLRKLWAILAKPVINASEDNSERLERFLEVHRHIRAEELFLKPVSETAQALSGRPGDAIMQAQADLQWGRSDNNFVIAYLRKTIAATLNEWQRRGETTAEHQIDLIIMPLARNAIVPTNEFATVMFAAALEAHLRQYRPGVLSEGFCKTWGALSDWIAGSGYRICKTWGVTAYSRLIIAMLSEQEPATDILNLVAADANSLASAIDDLGERSDKQLELMNRCHLLTPLYRLMPEFETLLETRPLRLGNDTGTAEPGIDRKQLIADVMKIFELSGDSTQQLEHAWMLNQMMRISLAWELLDPIVFTLLESPVDTGAWKKNRYSLPPLLYCAAALLRICLVDQNKFDEPVSSFFNATVALNRLAEKSPQRQQKAIALRALVGGIGLWWALRANDDIEQALGPFNGFNCLVNMFGALSDIPSLVKNKPNALKLANEALPYGEQGDKMRLLVSLEQLGMEPEKESAVGIDKLREYTELLLADIMSHDDMKEPDRNALDTGDLRQPAIYWAGVLMPRVRELLDAGGDGGGYDECTGLIKHLLRNLSKLKGEGHSYIAEHIWRKEEMEGVALLNVAEIKIPDAWREAFGAYKDGPPPSLAGFVREYAAKVFEAPRSSA